MDTVDGGILTVTQRILMVDGAALPENVVWIGGL